MGNVPLVDGAVERVRRATPEVAVNVHHGRALMEQHLEGRVHLSVEEPRVLGTAGALGHLRGWLDGRAALVVNADAWTEADLAGFATGWDGERVRLLLVGGGPLHPRSQLVATLVPWGTLAGLDPEPSGLWDRVFVPASEAGLLEVVAHEGPFIDCGTPRDYLRANLASSGGRPVVGEGARVEGELRRAVVWPGAQVHSGEVLVDAIRADGRVTVLVR